ncbi:MAG: transcription antitermination factor NusB [Patescibacteria group bacterium]
MSKRHVARSIIMQSLYQWDFKNQPTAAVPAIVAQNIKEFGAGVEETKEYIEDTVNAVIDNQPKIDALILRYAPNWPIDDMSLVDKNILRLGVYEMEFNTEVPPKVAINEAIELAKSYGGQSSGKFVNGILGAMYNDLQPKEEIKKTSDDDDSSDDARSNK